jgi:phenylpyruvate tautomerase PptA (4-oxalocrotonate tautomerase family)
MPMIDLTFVRGSLDDPSVRRLTDELVTVLLRAERAPDTPFLRDNTIVYLHALQPAAQSVGGRERGEPRFRVEMTVFEGVLSQDHKEQLAADVHAAVCAAAGLDPKGSRALHVWTLIHEVPKETGPAAARSSTTETSRGSSRTTDPDRPFTRARRRAPGRYVRDAPLLAVMASTGTILPPLIHFLPRPN